ncbi:MAG: adenylate/guanylate cyclase domain-containing protein [Pseudomonadota bacterium]
MEKHIDCAVMFVDIAGSTKLYHEYGDTLAQDSIARSLIRMSEMIKRNKGTVIKFIGDEILCHFPDVSAAIHTAFTLNEILDQTEDPNGIEIKIRIGLHYGPTIIDQNDIYGDTVNVAAAMREIARSRQIITTGAVINEMPTDLLAKARQIDSSKLKGRQEETAIYELQWEDEEPTAIHSALTENKEEATSHLQIKYRNKEISLLKDMQPFTFGRDENCSMTIESKLISRNHASIEYRKGKFIFVDTSTNGTYIQTEEGRNVFIRREEVPLWGLGNISLGRVPEEDEENLIRYISH